MEKYREKLDGAREGIMKKVIKQTHAFFMFKMMPPRGALKLFV